MSAAKIGGRAPNHVFLLLRPISGVKTIVVSLAVFYARIAAAYQVLRRDRRKQCPARERDGAMRNASVPHWLGSQSRQLWSRWIELAINVGDRYGIQL
jgi:hypothetical protein